MHTFVIIKEKVFMEKREHLKNHILAEIENISKLNIGACPLRLHFEEKNLHHF